MITVTNTEKEDFAEVMALINHVFGKENASVKMEDIFTDLLCEDNRNHMKIIKVDGKPVSVINYVINEIDMNGCTMKAANIGAVCTQEDHRRKGYAKLILEHCLDVMNKEGVDFLYVSGEIDLYTKSNIHITGKMYNFSLDQNASAAYQELCKEACEVKECSQEDISLLSAIYDAETVKFIRDRQRFSDLAGRVPGAAVFDHTAKLFRIEQNGQIQGYFICALVPKENGDVTMEVIEYAGKRKPVLAGIIKAMVKLNAVSISGYAMLCDADMISVLDEYQLKTEVCNYPGTMRIINFATFMQKLKPIFTAEKMLYDMEFCESDGKYRIRSGIMELVIENDKTMHDLVLGNDMEVLKTEHVSGDNTLLDMLGSILPISVPYPYNLNYI